MRTNSPLRIAIRLATAAGGLLVAAAIVACSEGSDAGAPTPPATREQVSPSPTLENGSALPLQRYHYVASFTLQTKDGVPNGGDLAIKTQGTYEAPDRHAFTYSITSGENTLRQRAVMIGDDVWLKQGSSPWRQGAKDSTEVRELLAAAFSPVREGFLGGDDYLDVRDAARRLPSLEESVNDVPSNHYRVSQAGQEYFETFLVEEGLLANADDFSWDLWLAHDGGWPVRMRASSTVTKSLQINRALEVPAPAVWELQIDISRPDDPRLAVQPPNVKG